MTLILLLVLVGMFLYHGSRISKLEQIIKGKSIVEKPVVPNQARVPNVGETVLASDISPAPTVLPVMQKQETVQVSGEEMSGRILGRIGIGALVIGIGFFLKYAFDNNWVGPAGRVMIGIVLGMVIMALGQWLRKKYLGYSDLLMGGGLAVLYLSVYSAFSLYHLIDSMTAFLGLVVITAVGVGISIMNATQSLSVIALIGGYFAPMVIGVSLLGTTVTFIYLTILNSGVLGILLYKKWEPLVVIGLFGTWIHFGSWLTTSYNESLLIPTLFFILVQFLIFTASSVVRIIREKRKATEADYAIITVTAISFASVVYVLLMPKYEGSLALGAVLVAIFYGVIAMVAYKENPSDRTINIFLPGMSVAFLTAAIAIQFSGPWIAVWWFAESVVLYMVASKSSSRGFQVMGAFVYVFALMKMFYFIFNFVMPVDFVVIFNTPFALLALAVLVAYVNAFVYFRYGSISSDIQKRGISAFIIVANVLTVYALTTQVTAYYGIQLRGHSYGDVVYGTIKNTSNTIVSIVWALYAALLTIIGFAKNYSAVRRMGLFLFILTACKVMIDVWNLGQLYRIVSFVVFGIIALAASFMYVKYKDKLKEIV